MIDPSKTDVRPYFFDIWKKHHFPVGALALTIGVPEEMIVGMLHRKPVDRNIAEQALAKINLWFNQNYTLENVKINL